LVSHTLEVVYAAVVATGLAGIAVGGDPAIHGDALPEHAAQARCALVVDLAGLGDAGLVDTHQVGAAVAVIGAAGDHTSIADARLAIGAVRVEAALGDL